MQGRAGTPSEPDVRLSPHPARGCPPTRAPNAGRQGRGRRRGARSCAGIAGVYPFRGLDLELARLGRSGPISRLTTRAS